MIHLLTPDAPTDADYQQVIDHLAALGVYLEILEQAAGLPDRDDQWGKAVNQAISHARSVLLALLFSVTTHCLLAGYLLDYKQMDRVTVTLRTRSSIDPDDDLGALIPTATACYSTLKRRRDACDCLLDVAVAVQEAVQAIRAYAPERKGN